MEKRILLAVLALTLVFLTLALLLPGSRTPDANPRLPWRIERETNGSTRVFDLTLEQSTLEDARRILQRDPTLSLFEDPDGRLSLEAWFDRVFLSGLKGDFVLGLSANPSLLESLRASGQRSSKLGDGTRKIELADADLSRALTLPIDLITYIPAANLEPDLIQSRFGEPQRKITERTGAVHWLYPNLGLDLTWNESAKEVLQYVHPRNFSALLDPLLNPPEHVPGQRSL